MEHKLTIEQVRDLLCHIQEDLAEIKAGLDSFNSNTNTTE